MRRAIILSALLAAACASPSNNSPTAPASAPEVSVDAGPERAKAAPAAPSRGGAPTTSAPSRLLGRNVRAQPVRPLNVRTECRFRNETGYNGAATVEVVEGQVKRLSASFNVPDRGQCQIDLKSLRQTRSLPSVELRDPQSRCVARLWEQGDKATVSFSGCANYCSQPEAFAYVWPILIHRPTGRCD